MAVVHEAAAAGYTLQYVVESNDFDLNDSNTGTLELLFPNGDTKSLAGTLTGKSLTQVTVSKALVAGDLTGAQGVVRYFAVVVLTGGERVVFPPRLLRVRAEEDV